MIRWTGLASWEFEFPFPGCLTSTPPEQVEPRLNLALLYHERGPKYREKATPTP